MAGFQMPGVVDLGCRFQRNELSKVGEFHLGLGLVCLTLGAALWQFPIIGLLGVAFLLAALIFLLAASIFARGAAFGMATAGPGKDLLRGSTIRPSHPCLGLLLFIAGLAGLVVGTGQATVLAHERALHAEVSRSLELDAGPPPTAALWPWVLLSCPVACLILAIGLRLRSGWSSARAACWAWAACWVCPIAVAVFNVLAPILQLGS